MRGGHFVSASMGGWQAGYLTGNFDVVSGFRGRSTGIMDLRTNQWRREMLEGWRNGMARAWAG